MLGIRGSIGLRSSTLIPVASSAKRLNGGPPPCFPARSSPRGVPGVWEGLSSVVSCRAIYISLSVTNHYLRTTRLEALEGSLAAFSAMISTMSGAASNSASSIIVPAPDDLEGPIRKALARRESA